MKTLRKHFEAAGKMVIFLTVAILLLGERDDVVFVSIGIVSGGYGLAAQSQGAVLVGGLSITIGVVLGLAEWFLSSGSGQPDWIDEIETEGDCR